MTGAASRSRSMLLYGTDEPAVSLRRLSAGKLAADLDGGNLRYKARQKLMFASALRPVVCRALACSSQGMRRSRVSGTARWCCSLALVLIP